MRQFPRQPCPAGIHDSPLPCSTALCAGAPDWKGRSLPEFASAIDTGGQESSHEIVKNLNWIRQTASQDFPDPVNSLPQTPFGTVEPEFVLISDRSV